jgi:hypothetical protein
MQTYSAATMSGHLRTILRTLYDVPRVIVNIIGMFHVELLRQVGLHDKTCEVLHT